MCARIVLLVVILSAAPLAAASPPSGGETLVVRIHLAFDASVGAAALKRIASEEAARIWRVYGVDLQWTDRERSDLFLDASVTRDQAIPDGPMVLGHTRISSEVQAQAPIEISFDAVHALLARRRGGTSMPQEREVAIALGRVLAHEVGHVLLGPPAYHDPDGLMRTTFHADDLLFGPPSAFRLTEQSGARLRRRMASLAHPQLPETVASASWVAWGVPQPDIR
jgi:hypothetical protein